MIVVGVAFLLNDIIPDAHMQDFIWPGILIIAGIIFILKPSAFPHYNNDMERLAKWEKYERRLE